MLLDGINGDLKNAAEQADVTKLLQGKGAKEQMIHEAMISPQFAVLSGGGPTLTNSQGVPWTASYVNANGDLTVDLRSNMAAESCAKIVYEYLLQFTDDPFVHDSLRFLMTREIAHFAMFEAALADIQPNFQPGILQGDPRHTHFYYNMSNDASARGPWNQGPDRGPKASNGCISRIRCNMSVKPTGSSVITRSRVHPSPKMISKRRRGCAASSAAKR